MGALTTLTRADAVMARIGLAMGEGASLKRRVLDWYLSWLRAPLSTASGSRPAPRRMHCCKRMAPCAKLADYDGPGLEVSG